MQNHPYSVLVIDDDPNVRDILSDLLKRERCVVRTAASGLSGIAVAHEALPDLILLDVMMPDLDGFSVCRMLRDDPQTAEVPIIMITALDDRASRLEGVKAGADEFLSKPVELSELRLRVRTMQRINRYRRLIEERERAAAHERQLTEQAKQAAQAIAEAYDQTLIGWSRALDLRDKETEGHSQRVAQATITIAKALNIPPEEQINMWRGAMLHDIGKIGVPDSILHKPGPLTEAEWEIMRRHTTYAYELLSPIAYLRPAIDIPYCHHEKWDGTGYPRGLRGEQIPLAARIFALVDVWDALTNDRPYRRAWTREQACQYIREQAGKHFDPNLVDLFLSITAPDLVATHKQ
ncbi:HD domain-containing phosphohydrolase [uncultured Chloroflexus sp.]|uniref:HD domain-containing phosphohydrolase n=1 Tax=uncultured Chloroflexus sp. TaxID=214040 RepID=UPI00262197EF|nr:HD domain-containing phosphohydrolase [uncultured Chloroflexus sp.]